MTKDAPASFEMTDLGPLPEGWDVVRLGDAANLIMGQSPPGSTYNEKGDGVPFLQGKAEFGDVYPRYVNYRPINGLAFAPGWKFTHASCMPDYRSRLASICFDCISTACNDLSRLLSMSIHHRLESQCFLDILTIKSTTYSKKIAPKKSILMSVRAPVGDVNIADIDYCIGRGLSSISLKNGDNQYLFYNLTFIKPSIEKAGTGILRMSIAMEKYGLKKPEIETDDNWFSIIFKRRKVQKGRKNRDMTSEQDSVDIDFRENFRVNFRVKFSVTGNRLDRMVDMILGLSSGRLLNVKESAEKYDISVRTIYEDLSRLEEWNIVRFEGPPKTGRYALTEFGKTLLKGVENFD